MRSVGSTPRGLWLLAAALLLSYPSVSRVQEPGDAPGAAPAPGPEERTDIEFASTPRIDLDALDPPGEDIPPIDELLRRMAPVASLYLDSALNFTVVEHTEVITHNYVSGYRHRYNAPRSVYCYYETGNGRLDDRRIAKKELSRLKKRLTRGEDVSAELANAPDPLRGNTSIPSYVVRPFSWILLFAPDARQTYRYRILGVDRKGIWVGLEPSARDPDPSTWYADVLVDPQTHQVLTVEAYRHVDVVELELARAMLESDEELPLGAAERTFVEVNTRVEFAYTARGLRFPSRVESKIFHHIIAEPLTKRFGKKKLAFEIVQKYKDYEFYEVEVDETLTGSIDRSLNDSGSR